jgi:hypothetical protein
MAVQREEEASGPRRLSLEARVSNEIVRTI